MERDDELLERRRQRDQRQPRIEASARYCRASRTSSDGARLARGTCVRRGLGLDERELVARPDSPSRCTLPITALRVTPPRRPAIWLALKPSAQSFFSSSTLSSVQAMVWPPRIGLRIPPSRPRDGVQTLRITAENDRPGATQHPRSSCGRAVITLLYPAKTRQASATLGESVFHRNEVESATSSARTQIDAWMKAWTSVG